MNVVLARGEAAYRIKPVPSSPVSKPRDYGELGAKIAILTLFSSMATRLAKDAAETGHVTGMLMLASEALVVALTLVRRSAGTVDRSWKARLLTIFSTFGPPLVRPISVATLSSESVAIIISAIGLMVVVTGKLSLGRSFGLSPANRGIVCSGLYRFVRHPIYLGYLLTHAGFAVAYPADWNLVVLAAADTALMFRAIFEERTLALDGEYRSYMQRVRWRIFPGVF